MRKKFFPRNARHSATRGQLRPRRLAVRSAMTDGRKDVISARDEFDRLLGMVDTIDSVDDAEVLWKEVVLNMHRSPGRPLRDVMADTIGTHTGSRLAHQ